MSTSLLYHRFGIVGYRYVSQKFMAGGTVFRIEQPRDRLRCSHCGSDAVWAQGGSERRFKGLPIGKQPTLIEFEVPRVRCWECGLVRQVKIQFADPKKRYTRAFERYALDLSQHMTIQDVAHHLQVSWDTIKEIQATDLKRRFGKPKLGKLKQIAIDEINVGHGHRYLTIVLNLLTGAVVFVGDGKGAEALDPFWKQLRRARAKVEAVATDMSPAYTKAVRDHLPDAVHVFDHFHVIKLYNEKLSDFRRHLFHQLTRQEQQLVKGIRWLLLKSSENLDPEKREPERLKKALALNEPLAIVYYMKEDLRQLWTQGSKFLARLFLEEWLEMARSSGIRMLQKFAKMLQKHQEEILNYYDYRISTGPLEGTNTKIQVMKRQAYGYRDHEFLKLKILGIHQSKYALVG
jgi:transposase